MGAWGVGVGGVRMRNTGMFFDLIVSFCFECIERGRERDWIGEG